MTDGGKKNNMRQFTHAGGVFPIRNARGKGAGSMDCLTLKKSNCKNCYKCIRHCPVKSIRFSGNQAYIIGNECIL